MSFEIRSVNFKIVVATVLACALAATLGFVLSSGGGPPSPPPVASQARVALPAPATATATPSSPGAPQGTTLLATVLVNASRYSSPGGKVTGSVPAIWHARPSILPVIASEPGWVQVRLAQRPNESTGWLQAKDVRLGITPYRLVINLTTTHLTLYNAGREVFSAPAGVGTTDDPTPTGEFFVAFDEPPLSSGYGAFIMVTSAHSPSISDWEGSGDAIIGIHGPLGLDAQIGTHGAKISHGCVRLHNQALNQLASVPPGTPIDVVS